MKKCSILCVLAVMMAFSGCMASSEDPYLVDTVIQIPMNPTEAPLPEITEPQPEAATEAVQTAALETAPAEVTASKPESTKTSSGKATASKKPASSKTSSTAKPKETKPAETVPPTAAPTETPTEPPFDPAAYIPGDLEYAFLDELNSQRSAAGSAALNLSKELSGIAALRAREISHTWSSTRPDGRSYTSAMEDHGYSFTTAAQLLIHTAGNGDAPALVDRWMGIDANRVNILNNSFDTVGIGVYRANGMIYIACILAN